eukprot:16447636-Heterocapsa_arctica.AAC.1
MISCQATDDKWKFKHRTSDELALHLLGLHASWVIYLCDYDMVSTMRMLVTGVRLDERFRHSSRAPKPKAQKDQLLQDALMLASLGDPSAAKAGRGRGSAGRRGRPPTRGASGSGPGLVEAAVGA